MTDAERQQQVAEARAEGIAVGRLSGDMLVAEMRGRYEVPDCPECGHDPLRRCRRCNSKCATCEHEGLKQRIRFTADYEAVKARAEAADRQLPQLQAIVDEMTNYPHIQADFHSGDREPGTLAEGVARKKVDEWRDRLAGLTQPGAASPLPDDYWRLRVEHARKQGDADGFQKGWHAALTRIRQGDAIDELAALVPGAASPERT